MFAEQLKNAKEELGKLGIELWLLQLGDMFDLWLGFDRFFNSYPANANSMRLTDGSDGKVFLDNSGTTKATEFVDFWVKHTLYRTSQSEHVRKFLEYGSHSQFLYGNHDNYLAKHPAEIANNKIKRFFYDRDARLYACHGHQWDPMNRDGAIGGIKMTQSAFWGKGAIIREMEPDGRIPSFLQAKDLFLGKYPFSVFAMGHTHVGMLSEMVIEEDYVRSQ